MKHLYFTSHPSLWPSGIGKHLGWNRLWVRILTVSDINHISCSMSLRLLGFLLGFLGTYGFTSHPILSHPIASYPITSNHIPSYHISSHPIISHPIPSHHITSHHIPSHHITSYHITSHHIPSHHITWGENLRNKYMILKHLIEQIIFKTVDRTDKSRITSNL